MACKYLVTAAIVLAAATPVSAQSVKAGIEAWQRSDYSAAVAIWKPLADKGDADAAFNLGQAYRLGRGVPINLAEAQAWLTRAASKGHVDAETTLGLLLFQNGNQTGGLRWLKAAADKSEPRALLVYGTALYNGDGISKDPVLGYACISRAAAQGLQPARDTLAQLDDILPAELRKKGVALALQMVKSAPAPSSAPAKAVESKAAKSAKAAAPAQSAQKPPVKSTANPAATPVASKEAEVAPSGGWRIQLGAFSKDGSAKALFARLSAGLAGRQPFYVRSGTVTRLQVGPYPDRQAASAACASLKGQPCFVVSAK